LLSDPVGSFYPDSSPQNGIPVSVPSPPNPQQEPTKLNPPIPNSMPYQPQPGPPDGKLGPGDTKSQLAIFLHKMLLRSLNFAQNAFKAQRAFCIKQLSFLM
jgi:hypothetical protein